MEVIENLFRTLMFFFDNIIYGLIPTIYKLFIYLSELNLFSDNPDSPIQQLVARIYTLLGIFMLFKVSFSLLQYIVDPNSFRDSSKGMGKLITNVLVALVLLVAVPSIFSVAMRLQTVIVQSNAIGNLILGSSNSDGVYVIENGHISDEVVERMATDLQFMVYGAFYKINDEVMEADSDDNNPKLLSDCAGSSGILGSVDMATINDGKCLASLNKNLPDDATSNGVSLYSFFKYRDESKGSTLADQIQDERQFSHLDKLLWWKDDGVYVIDYLPFISALAGIYIVFLLIGFTVDIAVRSIKLCFLQMIAPIAIVSYIDPKESISNGKLHNWIKECATTYFSLFLRLATIFLVMFITSMIASTLLTNDQQYISGLSSNSTYNIWIYLFLVIGAFMFAQKVPGIIESIFGIKNSGDFNLNPFKNTGATTLLGGVAGLGIGTVASGISAAKTSLESGERGLTTFRRTLGGAVSGGLKGGISSATAHGKGFMSKSFNAAGDVARSTAMKANTKARYRYGAYIRNAIGAQSLKENLDQRAAVFENFEKGAGDMEARARDQLAKKDDTWKIIQAQRARDEKLFSDGRLDENEYKARMSKHFSDEQGRINAYINSNGTIIGDNDFDLMKTKESFIRNINENGLDGMENLSEEAKAEVMKQIKENNLQWDNIDSIKKAAHKEAVEIKNSDKYEDASNAEKAKLSDLRQSFLNK